ncbi:MAG: glutamate-1-semialdehyde 2,1-aminomutase [Actinomycetota bacterium]|nr:glutamate-1-semialdehyde 2,1-aminomutase [Actinomycetota bacterium]
MTSNEELFDRASRVIPGGVNSPVRAFRSVGGTPAFAVRGRGAVVVDTNGRELVDYIQSWGALLFGHARPEIVEAAVRAAERGTSFGMPTEAEVELAERLAALVPSIEMIRLVSSGTEAAMSAIRLARAVTGRSRIVKFDGCYHGHADALLASAGSGVATLGIPGTPGITPGAAGDTVVVPFNDLGAVHDAFERSPDEIACVIVEPVAANMGVVPPAASFMEGLREVTTTAGALLVFDEVITGFRLAAGGAQQRLGVTPDLTVLGKIMGGGFPVAAFGGRADLMRGLAPEGPVYQAGTLSGNPVGVAAGLAALDLVEKEDPYLGLEETAHRLTQEITSALADAGVAHRLNRSGSLFSLFFSDADVRDSQGAHAADHATYGRFFHAMLEARVLLPPSGYEAWFLGTAHGDEEIERTIAAVRGAVLRIGGGD